MGGDGGNNWHCMSDVVIIATKPKYEVWVEMLLRDFMSLFCVTIQKRDVLHLLIGVRSPLFLK
jgi:hypothetical protein